MARRASWLAPLIALVLAACPAVARADDAPVAQSDEAPLSLDRSSWG